MKTNIKTYEDARAALNINPEWKPDFSILPASQQKFALAAIKLGIIAQALNEGWEPNWENRNELKYLPWFRYSPGVGFSYYDCGYVRSFSHVGSRLYYKSSELAIYAGKQFLELYNEFLTV